MRHLFLVVAALVAGPAAAFQLPWAAEKPAAPELPPPPVVSVTVADAAADSRIIPGTVAARSEVQLGFQTLGRLVLRNADVGDTVKAGQALAALNPDDLQDNVRAARGLMSSAEVARDTAEATARRTRELAARNVASQAQLEQAERALKSAEAAFAQAQSELARAKDAEGFAQLIAPFDGVVSAVMANPGAVVGAGEPVLTLATIDNREVVIDLPEYALAAAKVGARYRVWPESDHDAGTHATVERIEPLADAATRMRRVHLKLDNDAAFRLGALALARTDDDSGALLTVPEAAIVEDAGKLFVWVVHRKEGNATVARTPVTLSSRGDGNAIVNGGIAPGTEIVIRGVHSLTDGQPVGRSVAP